MKMKYSFKVPKYDPEEYNPLTKIAEQIGDLLCKIKQRCLLEGCRFGIEHVDKKPKDFCIYCGEPIQPQEDFWGDSTTYEQLLAEKLMNKVRNTRLNNYIESKRK